MPRSTTPIAKRLAPEALHRAIRHAGLEACAHLLEAATPEQLTAVLDLDLWTAPRAGREEQLSEERFGEWLEVLVGQGTATAARVVGHLDARLVATGLSRYVRVFDPGVLIPTESSDDEPLESRLFESTGATAEIGGYMVQARREDAWDAIVALLVELSSGESACFDTILRECRRLSHGEREVDGLDVLPDARDQSLHDLAIERDDRRSERGFGSWADARVFLASARQRRPAGRAEDRADAASLRPLDGGLQVLIDYLLEHHPEAYLERGQELAFLANALVAGCGLRTGAFTPPEAVRAAMATCNLGLLRQPVRPGIDHLVGCGLVSLFEDGWGALHRDVSLSVADGLLAVLSAVPAGGSDTLEDLRALRRSLEAQRATPWLALDDLDVLSVLDPAAWYGLCGLMSECPVLPDAVVAIVERRAGGIDPDAFAFIATDAQIETVRAFMARLPDQLAA